jgi:D-proline reductase (dithiol) PrdB
MIVHEMASMIPARLEPDRPRQGRIVSAARRLTADCRRLPIQCTFPERAMRPPVDYIERTRAQYAALGYPPYQWVHHEDDPPFTPLAKPLAECRVALVASGGIYATGQVAFHYRDDTSIRIIPRDTPIRELRVTHFAYDLTDARADPNVVFPLEALRDLERIGRIGETGPNAYTFMGGIYSSRKVRDRMAPAIAARLVKDEVDAAILVPV